MKNPVRTGHRPQIALAILVLLVSFAGGTAASGASGGRDDGDRYRDGYGYRDRDGDRRYYHDDDDDDDDGGRYKKRWKHKGHDGYYRGRHRHDRYYYDRGSYYRPRHFSVPHHLYRHDYGPYERYYRGSAYYAPHRHSHRIYMFPVIVDGYYTDYRPYAYCGEAYYPDHYHGGSRGHLGLHFQF